MYPTKTIIMNVIMTVHDVLTIVPLLGNKTVITLLKIDGFSVCFLFCNLDTSCLFISIVWSPQGSPKTMILSIIIKNCIINRTKSMKKSRNLAFISLCVT